MREGAVREKPVPKGLLLYSTKEPAEGAQTTFDPVEQDKALAAIHTRAVDDALFVWICHDVNPRGLSAKVKPFSAANSWYVDLTAVDVA